MSLLFFALACSVDPAFEARVAVLEAQHAADSARIAALEEGLARLDTLLEMAEQLSGHGAESPAEPPVGAPTCTQDGDTFVLPGRDRVTAEALATEARVVPASPAPAPPDLYMQPTFR